jgi:hypothetical protein
MRFFHHDNGITGARGVKQRKKKNAIVCLFSSLNGYSVDSFFLGALLLPFIGPLSSPIFFSTLTGCQQTHNSTAIQCTMMQPAAPCDLGHRWLRGF